MKYYEIPKLLNNSTISKFATKKYVQVNDLSSFHSSLNKNIKLKTSMLRSDLCDYSNGYIVVKGTINFSAATGNENAKAQKNVPFKNNSPFRAYISKINSTLIDNAQDHDIVLPIYNLLNIVKIIPRHKEVYGIIIEAKLMTAMKMPQMINHLNIKDK